MGTREESEEEVGQKRKEKNTREKVLRKEVDWGKEKKKMKRSLHAVVLTQSEVNISYLFPCQTVGL